jgi:hypothetical protein
MNPIRQISPNDEVAAFACGDEGMLATSSQQTSRASACMRNSGGIFFPTLQAVKATPPVKFGRESANYLTRIGLPADWQNHPLWKS